MQEKSPEPFELRKRVKGAFVVCGRRSGCVQLGVTRKRPRWVRLLATPGYRLTCRRDSEPSHEHWKRREMTEHGSDRPIGVLPDLGTVVRELCARLVDGWKRKMQSHGMLPGVWKCWRSDAGD